MGGAAEGARSRRLRHACAACDLGERTHPAPPAHSGNGCSISDRRDQIEGQNTCTAHRAVAYRGAGTGCETASTPCTTNISTLNEEETHAFTLEPSFARHCGLRRSREHRARRLLRWRRRRHGHGPGDVGEADGVVTIIGTIADTEAELLEQSWADWEEENDIDIQYESTKEFEAQIGSLAQGGNPPDLAIFPQPGLLADLASRDYIQPAPEGVAANVADGWSEDWAAYGTVDGTLYGAPLMASVKGFIWYSPAGLRRRTAGRSRRPGMTC